MGLGKSRKSLELIDCGPELYRLENNLIDAQIHVQDCRGELDVSAGAA